MGVESSVQWEYIESSLGCPLCSTDDSPPILMLILLPFYCWFKFHSTDDYTPDDSTPILLMILLPFCWWVYQMQLPLLLILGMLLPYNTTIPWMKTLLFLLASTIEIDKT